MNYVIAEKRHITDVNITPSFHNTCYLFLTIFIFRSKTTFYLKHSRLQTSSVPKRINVLLLKTVEKQTELSLKLDTSHNTVDINDGLESSWNALCDAMHFASVAVFGILVCNP